MGADENLDGETRNKLENILRYVVKTSQYEGREEELISIVSNVLSANKDSSLADSGMIDLLNRGLPIDDGRFSEVILNQEYIFLSNFQNEKKDTTSEVDIASEDSIFRQLLNSLEFFYSNTELPQQKRFFSNLNICKDTLVKLSHFSEKTIFSVFALMSYHGTFLQEVFTPPESSRLVNEYYEIMEILGLNISREMLDHALYTVSDKYVSDGTPGTTQDGAWLNMDRFQVPLEPYTITDFRTGSSTKPDTDPITPEKLREENRYYAYTPGDIISGFAYNIDILSALNLYVISGLIKEFDTFIHYPVPKDKISPEEAVIYASPAKRTKQTAEYISKKLKVPIVILPELMEIRFDTLPMEIFSKGKNAIREFLLTECEKADVKIRKDIFEEKAIIITHGFIMRKIFYSLFSTKQFSLKNDSRFVNYLSGFDCRKGEPLSLIKEC